MKKETKHTVICTQRLMHSVSFAGAVELTEPAAPINDSCEDSYVMQVLTTPACVILSGRVVAISAEDIAMQALDFPVSSLSSFNAPSEFSK